MNKKKLQSLMDPRFFKGICHRGLHNEQFTENGLPAFKNAIEHGMAFELDVHLTKDGQLLVCHDSDMERVTGKKGIIEELTLSEIKEGYRLHDGSLLPTLDEVLSLCSEQVPVVVELKPRNKNFKPLGKAALASLASIKDKKKITFISFDPRALIQVKHHGFTTGLLITVSHTKVFSLRHFFDYLDVEECLLTHKTVLSYRKNHLVNVWTIRSPESFIKANELADMITFERFDPEVVFSYYHH